MVLSLFSHKATHLKLNGVLVAVILKKKYLKLPYILLEFCEEEYAQVFENLEVLEVLDLGVASLTVGVCNKESKYEGKTLLCVSTMNGRSAVFMGE